MIAGVLLLAQRFPICGLIAGLAACLPLQFAAAGDAKILPVAGCVTIGTPKPNRGYTYRVTHSSGGASEFTDWWESYTETGSHLLTTPGRTKGAGILTVNRHRIVNDVMVLDSSSQRGPDGASSSSFRPAVVSNPAFRACQGRSWPVPSVTATYQSARGAMSARSDEGTLKIVAINEPITVPAGRFDTVHWTRNERSQIGPLLNEYWTSIEHGVVVKRMNTVRGVVVTATLESIL